MITIESLLDRWSQPSNDAVYPMDYSMDGLTQYVWDIYDQMSNDYINLEVMNDEVSEEYVGDLFTADELRFLFTYV